MGIEEDHFRITSHARHVIVKRPPPVAERGDLE
jgi:hypothetical protein